MAAEPASPESWTELPAGATTAPFISRLDVGRRIELRFQGRTASGASEPAQTLLTAFSPGSLAPLWIGLRGPRQTLTVIFGREPGRSPHYWIGPDLADGRDFDLHLAVCPDMGPGGVLHRLDEETRWSSLAAASATGLAALHWPERWSIGHGQHGGDDRRFLGAGLKVAFAVG